MFNIKDYEVDPIDQNKIGSYFNRLSTLIDLSDLDFEQNSGFFLIQIPDFEEHPFGVESYMDKTIKEFTMEIVNSLSDVLDKELGDAAQYFLKIPEDTFLDFDELKLIDIPFIKNCYDRGFTIDLVLYKRSSVIKKKNQMLNREITMIVGTSPIMRPEYIEASVFRQSAAKMKLRLSEDQNENIVRGLPINITRNDVVIPNGKSLVKIYIKESSAEFNTMEVRDVSTADEFITRIFNKFIKYLFPEKSSQEFTLKVLGLVDYILGDDLFHHFDHIRNCLISGSKIELVLLAIDELPSTSFVEDVIEETQFENFDYDPLIEFTHHDITSADPRRFISSHELLKSLKFRIVGIEGLKQNMISEEENILITIETYCGTKQLPEVYSTSSIPFNPIEPVLWYEWINFHMNLQNFPRETKFCVTVYSESKKGIATPVAWVNIMLYDFKHEMLTGLQTFGLWNDGRAAHPRSPSTRPRNNCPLLFIEFEQYSLPILFPMGGGGASMEYPPPVKLSREEALHIKSIIDGDTFTEYEQPAVQLIWKQRKLMMTKKRTLSKFLMSAPAYDYSAVREVHSLLNDWYVPSPREALELLDASYSDFKVREYAVRLIGEMSSEELSDYLLQLVQSLKYEPYHQSALSFFLLERAFKNKSIAHKLFWHLKSEIHNPFMHERFSLMLECYLRGSRKHMTGLQQQEFIQTRFIDIANRIKVIKENQSKSDTLDNLRGMLSEITFQDPLQLPLDPRIEVCGIKLDKCKFMDSKMAPLWVEFTNADPLAGNVTVIFKSGDDLRQDMLTMQLLTIMDRIWKRNGLDLCMSTYRCVATGDDVGMLEVVQRARTCADISASGAKVKTSGAFKENTFYKWLRDKNNTPMLFDSAVDNFVRSCAAYCVASYVIGIGDRHNDNIMIKETGEFFHIDFGHILGNYKYVYGVIPRETTPFVFTQSFSYVMKKVEGKYEEFKSLAATAFNLLRRNSDLLLNLCLLMIPSGMPELEKKEDIRYMRDAFKLDLSEDKAAEFFNRLIEKSETNAVTLVNDAFHIWFHK